MGNFLARATRGGTLRQIQHVTPVPPAAAQGLVAQVYAQVERDFGMLAPPISLHSPAPDCLAASWLILRESLITPAATTRAEREAVAAAVSVANTCPYCVDVHATTLTGLTEPGQEHDPWLGELSAWAASSASPDPLAAPFPAAQAPELIGTAVTFHYLNRMVNIFLPPSPFPSQVKGTGRRVAVRMAARLMGSLARQPVGSHSAHDLLPSAELPADLAWASGTPLVASAFAAAAHTIEIAGEEVIPYPVREIAVRHLGAAPGLNARAWLDEATTPLDPGHRPIARLVLLTMAASYRVTPEVVAEAQLTDAELIRATSWAAMLAGRLAGARLARAVHPA